MCFPGGAVVKNLPVSGFESSLGNIPWGRKWQPTPVVWPGKFMDRGAWGGYSPCVCKESDTIEQPSTRTM